MGTALRPFLGSLAEDLSVLRPGEKALGERALDALEQIGIERPHAYRLDRTHQALEEFVGRHYDVSGLRRMYLAHWSYFTSTRAYQPQSVAPAQQNRALRRHELGLRPEQFDGIRTLWRQVVVDLEDQLRSLICDGPAMLAWVGGFATHDFSDDQRQNLQYLTPAFAQRLKREALLQDAGVATSALEVVLEALPAPSFIVDARLRPVHRNALAQQVRFDAVKMTFTRVVAPGLPTYYLAQTPVEAPAEAVTSASRRFGLTRTEQRVLELLLQGRTNRAMAVLVGCSERTIEAHVSRLLRKSHSGSRSELIAKVQRRVSP